MRAYLYWGIIVEDINQTVIRMPHTKLCPVKMLALMLKQTSSPPTLSTGDVVGSICSLSSV